MAVSAVVLVCMVDAHGACIAGFNQACILCATAGLFKAGLAKLRPPWKMHAKQDAC